MILLITKCININIHINIHIIIIIIVVVIIIAIILLISCTKPPLMMCPSVMYFWYIVPASR